MYTIEIDYTTGDSFGSHEECEKIGACWESKELARKALQSIKEHNEIWDQYSTSQEDKTKQCEKYDWYDSSGYSQSGEFGLNVEVDDGSIQLISTFWVGYFETLIGASIVVDGDDEDSFVC